MIFLRNRLCRRLFCQSHQFKTKNISQETFDFETSNEVLSLNEFRFSFEEDLKNSKRCSPREIYDYLNQTIVSQKDAKKVGFLY